MITTYQHPRVLLMIGNSTIFEDEIGANSFIYRGGCGGSFAPGGCETASCSFTISNFGGINDGLPLNDMAEVQIYIGYGETPETSTYDKFATVYLSDIKQLKNVFNCVGYDKLHEADKSNISFTAGTSTTVNDIIRDAAAASGITVAQYPSVGGNIAVDISSDLSMTCRQAISHALEISGNVGFCNASGELVCKWFDTSSPAKTFTDYANAEYSQVSGYTGITVGETTIGADPNLYVVSGNPFVSANNEAAIANRLYDILVVSGISYGGVGVLADPHIEPADVIQVPFFRSDGTTDTRLVPVADLTFKNSLILNISCNISTTDEATDLRQTIDQKAENSVTREEMEKYVDEHGGSGDYIATHSGIGYNTQFIGNIDFKSDETLNNPRNLTTTYDTEIVRDRVDRSSSSVNNYKLRPLYMPFKPSDVEAYGHTGFYQLAPLIIPFRIPFPTDINTWTYSSTYKTYEYELSESCVELPDNIDILGVSGSIGIQSAYPDQIAASNILQIRTKGYGISWSYSFRTYNDLSMIKFRLEIPQEALYTGQQDLLYYSPSDLETTAQPFACLSGVIYARDKLIVPSSN